MNLERLMTFLVTLGVVEALQFLTCGALWGVGGGWEAAEHVDGSELK